jgi:excisionase family DNA binding protein
MRLTLTVDDLEVEQFISKLFASQVQEALTILSDKPPADEHGDALFTIKEACDFLKISRGKLYSIMKDSKLESLRVGHKRLIQKRDLLSFIKTQKYNHEK